MTTDFAGHSDFASAVAIQADGKIVAAGEAIVPGSKEFALVRYNTDGSLDTSFDGDGKVTTDFASSSDFALAVAIQGDGKIVPRGAPMFPGVRSSPWPGTTPTAPSIPPSMRTGR